MITEDEMKEFLEKAKEMEFNSVVVSPTYVPLAKEILADTDIKVGSVVGFPLGFEDTEIKVCEAKELVKKDVDEIEVVMNLSYLKDEKYELLENEIRQLKEVAGDKILKVIIETKALEDYEKANAAKVAENSGADFVKTSTGFSSYGATAEDVALLKTITNDEIKIKASGGIRNFEIAESMLAAGADIVGTSAGKQLLVSCENE